MNYEDRLGEEWKDTGLSGRARSAILCVCVWLLTCKMWNCLEGFLKTSEVFHHEAKNIYAVPKSRK